MATAGARLCLHVANFAKAVAFVCLGGAAMFILCLLPAVHAQ